MYDVIIVGAGVAGSYLASKLKNINALVIEKDNKIKIKDSGIVSGRIFHFFKEKRLIKNKINSMKLYSPNNDISINTKKPFAFILNRDNFSKFLRSKTNENAEIIYETAKEIEYSKDFVRVVTNENEYICKLIVGADGANSLVRRSIGIRRPNLYVGIMAKTNYIIRDNISIYFNKYYSPDFFSWIIPQNDEYGLITALDPIERLNYFKNKINLPDGEIYAYYIPIGYTKTYGYRTILIGDACGHVKPITGGGIIFSLISAKYAADIINNAFKENRIDENFLSQYEKKWKKEFGLEIKKQLLFRNFYRYTTNRQIDKLFKIIKPTIEKIDYFDYDKLSRLWIKFPKLKLIKFIFDYFVFD
ncbi:MAG: NAD(P)/FAD-dependent oxidoreductase [Candidatus Aenigmatarchaeota archaeon]